MRQFGSAAERSRYSLQLIGYPIYREQQRNGHSPNRFERVTPSRRMGVCVRGQGLGGPDADRSGCEVAARRDACFPSERRDECAWRLVAHLARDRADRTTRRE